MKLSQRIFPIDSIVPIFSAPFRPEDTALLETRWFSLDEIAQPPKVPLSAVSPRP
jgi:hypothetical protein